MPDATHREFFDSRVSKSGSCWLWTGKTMKSGYGVMKHQGLEQLAHRFAWEQYRGPLGGGDLIDHLCHNKTCVNPQHLRVADHQANRENLPAARRDSDTGRRGVWKTKAGTFKAEVRSGERRYQQIFDTLDEADAAARSKRAEWFEVTGD